MTESLTPEMAAQHHRAIEPAPDATALPDLLLLERARGKEVRAFETLMRRYNQRLFRIARSIVADGNIAETVVEEAYLLAFSDIERYEPTGKFAAWLARLAFNQALAQRRTIRPSSIAAAAEPARSELASSGVSPADAHNEAPSSRQLLEHRIDELPEVFRTVLVLRTIEGISGIETAACLGINETTVRTRLYRAQRRLRIDWSQHAAAERSELFELTVNRGDLIVNRVLSRLNGASHSQQEC
ncbi:MAG: sigma-70 family RNA polymerase sigma factor [Steroidobacteraceae bacterium]